MFIRFENRKEAGIALSRELTEYAGRNDVVVLALPRGGVPVALEVANALRAPLDVFVVRKLGVPWQPELAFGAIASGGVMVLNNDTVDALRLSRDVIDDIAHGQQVELERRERLFRGGRPAMDLKNKTVIIVDDGLATGATMRAAIKAIKELGPAKMIAAAPVASRYTCDEISRMADVACICAVKPEPFYGVGMWYRDFTQTTDEEVQDLLAAGRRAAYTANSGG